jgi:hypothetical protein
MRRSLSMRWYAGLFVVLGVLIFGTLTPTGAQMVPYEDWTADRIDPTRWRVFSLGAGTAVYEVVRQITNGQLHHALRTYGGTRDDLGITTGINAIGFLQGGFTAVQWDTTVHGYILQGCPTPGSQPSALQVDLRMQLFNDGSPLGQNDLTGNVESRVRLQRQSNSSDPPEIVQAIGLVTRCSVPDCSTRDVVGEVSLGPVQAGQPNNFRMFWDTFRSSVEFQRNAEPPVHIPYTLPVVSPLRGGRVWQVQAIAANCTVSPRPFTEVSATIDNIFVFFP